MISFGQVALVVIVGILLFGNVSNILKDAALGIKSFREIMKDESYSNK